MSADVRAKWVRRVTLLLVLSSSLAVTGLLGLIGVLTPLERFLLDSRIRAFPVPPAQDMVIVDIDQQSLTRTGNWPWPRRIHAELVRRLTGWGARLIVFDVLFTGRSDPDDDAALAQAIREAGPGKVVLASIWSGTEESVGGSIRPHIERPLREFRAFAGTADFELDPDGAVRRAPPLVRNDEPSLAYSALQGLSLSEAARMERKWGTSGAIIPLSGGAQSYTTVSYVNVLDGIIDPRIDPALGNGDPSAANYASFFRNKIVFVGSSDLALHDIFTTATTGQGALTPGVEIQASLLAALRRDNLIRISPVWLDQLLSGLLALLAALGLYRFGWRRGLAVALLLAAGYGAVAVAAFPAGVALAISGPLTATGITLVSLLAHTLWREEREKQQVRATFGRYVSPKVIDRILHDPQRYRAVSAERRYITVLFVDLAGFTGFSEQRRAEEVQQLLNSYLREMTACILAYDGILDKYIGDGIMAVWGSLGTSDRKADAAAAVRAALAMQRKMADLREEWHEAGLPEFEARIGIHAGDALVGNFGSELQVNFTAVGDVVNTASRIEALNKVYGTRVLVSREAAELAGPGFLLRPLGAASIRGRTEAVDLFELLGEAEDVPASQEHPPCGAAVGEGGESGAPAPLGATASR